MSLRVIGAGVGRTGTTSLKLALEQLLGGPCYHMFEVARHPKHVPIWRAAIDGRLPDWEAIYGKFVATVDWPGAAFWRPLSEFYPEALVLLSVRGSSEEWFRSASGTIDKLLLLKPQPKNREFTAMARELLKTTFTRIPFEQDAAVTAYEGHNAAVRAGVAPERLLEWRVTDGWAPLCERLGVPVPNMPFPRVNTSEEFQAFLERRPEREPWLSRARRRVRR